MAKLASLFVAIPTFVFNFLCYPIIYLWVFVEAVQYIFVWEESGEDPKELPVFIFCLPVLAFLSSFLILYDCVIESVEKESVVFFLNLSGE